MKFVYKYCIYKQKRNLACKARHVSKHQRAPSYIPECGTVYWKDFNTPTFSDYCKIDTFFTSLFYLQMGFFLKTHIHTYQKQYNNLCYTISNLGPFATFLYIFQNNRIKKKRERNCKNGWIEIKSQIKILKIGGNATTFYMNRK